MQNLIGVDRRKGNTWSLFLRLNTSFSTTVKEGEELTSPCLPPNWQGEWEHNKITYKIKGQKAGIVTWPLVHLIMYIFIKETVTQVSTSFVSDREDYM